MKKEVYCPLCRSRIIDAENSVYTELRVIDPKGHDPPQQSWKPDYYVKCWKCKSEVALRKISLLNTS